MTEITTLPNKIFLRRSEILACPEISKKALRKAIDAGVIKRVVFPGGKYAKFRRDEVVRVFQLHEQRRTA
jgi:predicted site-specific integrase-resolvase